MVVTTYNGVRRTNSDGFYYEGQASTEDEVMTCSVNYSVGSLILCTNEDTDGKLSLYVLALSSDGRKYWKKAE